MTLEQLKSLRVGDIVRYTNKEDASHSYDSKVSVISDGMLELFDGNCYTCINLNDRDIEFIASTLALVSSTNELQIILHQIRDCEFDLGICQRRMDACVIANSKQTLIAEIASKNGEYKALLKDLRNKRDNLLKQGA